MYTKVNTPPDKKIRKLEEELTKKKEQLSALRKTIPQEEMPDYIFEDRNGKKIKFSKLFGKKKEMILIQNMGKACPYCTLWADGFNGLTDHLENRAAFVLVSSDEVKTQKAFADSRGWKFKMVSSKNNTFKKDLNFEGEKGDFFPGVCVFTIDDEGKIFLHTKAGFGPGDNFCNAWDLFDLLPGGAGKWSPKYVY